MKEKAPAGWEDTVQGLKKHPEIENPWALAWWMKDQGATPGGKEAATDYLAVWKKFMADPDSKKYLTQYPVEEVSAPSSVGQLYRKGKEAECLLRFGVRFCEGIKAADLDPVKREVPVYIISEGPGNKVDRHYYLKEALANSFKLFDGAKCYADHPSKSEEQDRPERSVRDIVGYYHTPQFIEGADGKGKIKSVLKINQGDAFTWAWDMLKEAVDYSAKYPEKDYVGISINADGVVRESEHHGETWNDVTDLTRVVSADMVTQPAAGGKPLREAEALRESVRHLLASDEKDAKGGSMEALMKAVEALKAALGKNPDHMKMYGPALDEMVKAVAAETEARAAEAKNAAPPPAKDAQPEPKDEEEAYAAEAMRYSSGKMTEGEKAMFEKWQGERMARKAIVARQLMDRKLAESGIPSQFHDELRIIMGGKTEKEMDTLIASRKALLESVQATRVPGAGAKGAGPETKTKIQESLAAAGLLKGGK